MKPPTQRLKMRPCRGTPKRTQKGFAEEYEDCEVSESEAIAVNSLGELVYNCNWQHTPPSGKAKGKDKGKSKGKSKAAL